MNKMLLSVITCVLLVTLIGCDAFVRKFTRKPKRAEGPEQLLVLAPQEYKAPEVSKEELYRKYFIFWRSWQDELIQVLLPKANHKKQIDCAEEALKNLASLRALLSEPLQRQLDGHIKRLSDLKDGITEDPYGLRVSVHRARAETIRQNIVREFSYTKVRKDVNR